MLRLCVLLTVVVYCNSCTLDVPRDDTTNSPDCYDSNGNSHTMYTEWSTDTERCVCSTYGIICCPSFENQGDWEKWLDEHGGYNHGNSWEHHDLSGVTGFIAYNHEAYT